MIKEKLEPKYTLTLEYQPASINPLCENHFSLPVY